MYRWKCLLVAVLVATMSGCSAVYSIDPVGEKPYPVKEEDWKGVWISNGAAVTFKVIDAEKGLVKVAWVEWKDHEAKLESYEIQLRESEKWIFANVRDDANGKPRFFWGPIKQEENQILAWRPDVAKFKALGKNGKLPSREDDNDIFLDHLTPEQLKVITSQSEGVLFEWNDPLVFIRIFK